MRQSSSTVSSPPASTSSSLAPRPFSTMNSGYPPTLPVVVENDSQADWVDLPAPFGGSSLGLGTPWNRSALGGAPSERRLSAGSCAPSTGSCMWSEALRPAFVWRSGLWARGSSLAWSSRAVWKRHSARRRCLA